eukprot:m.221323 g.221323  ORF g.221323 m.221323 type:complete len:557 (-) comp15925_c0_seq8:95-1765(-)
MYWMHVFFCTLVVPINVVGIVVQRISQRLAEDATISADDAYEMAEYSIHHGCLQLMNQTTIEQDWLGNFVSEELCARTCASQAYTVFGIKNFEEKSKRRCWCAEEFVEHTTSAELSENNCQHYRNKTDFHFVGKITSKLPAIVYLISFKKTFIPRHYGLLWIPDHFEHKYFRDFAVRRITIEDDLGKKMDGAETFESIRRRQADQFYENFCANGMNKALKLILTASTHYVARHDPHANLFANWPSRSVLFVGANEAYKVPFDNCLSYEFGYAPNRFRYRSNDNAGNRVKYAADLPEAMLPFITQYYVPPLETWKDAWFRHIPLYMRSEFIAVPGKLTITPASERQYVYSYMVSLTSISRRTCQQVVESENIIDANRKFFHVAAKWNGDPNSENYVHESQYRDIMSKSIFTLAPSGHNADQYRLYEAIAVGTIPVIDEEQLKWLAPSFKDSGMLVVKNWKEAPQRMNDLIQDMDELNIRQQKVIVWGEDLIRNSMKQLSDLLKKRLQEEDTPFCKEKVYKLEGYCDNLEHNKTDVCESAIQVFVDREKMKRPKKKAS